MTRHDTGGGSGTRLGAEGTGPSADGAPGAGGATRPRVERGAAGAAADRAAATDCPAVLPLGRGDASGTSTIAGTTGGADVGLCAGVEAGGPGTTIAFRSGDAAGESGTCARGVATDVASRTMRVGVGVGVGAPGVGVGSGCGAGVAYGAAGMVRCVAARVAGGFAARAGGAGGADAACGDDGGSGTFGDVCRHRSSVPPTAGWRGSKSRPSITYGSTPAAPDGSGMTPASAGTPSRSRMVLR